MKNNEQKKSQLQFLKLKYQLKSNNFKNHQLIEDFGGKKRGKQNINKTMVEFLNVFLIKIESRI